MKHSSVRTKSANCVNCPELSRWRLGVEIKANHAFRQASAYCGPPLDESKKTNKQRERERERERDLFDHRKNTHLCFLEPSKLLYKHDELLF